jgi:hypothetical protein
MGKSTNHGYAGAYFQTDDAEVITDALYGVRYPDGTLYWETNGLTTYRSAASSENARLHWEAKLRERARELHIDPDTYVAGHTLIKRTVIISSTAPEEV